METTPTARLEEELAALAAHINAATARFVELVRELSEDGGLADETARFVAFRCGISAREAREVLRVAEALRELPAIRAAFARGERTFTKVRSLTRVATASSEEGLLELACALTAARLERALRAFRRLAAEEFEPTRSTRVEALTELAEASLAGSGDGVSRRARLVVHVDAASLSGERARRCEPDDGPVVSAETALRLGCDADTMTTIERDGVPLSVGRARRTVPPVLRRALEARDEGTCCSPGCENRRHLDAHHRVHWAHGGETSLTNLVLLCWHHHRLVHEGGYSIEDDPVGRLRFRNRYGVLCPSVPPRAPPGSADELMARHARLGLAIDAETNRAGYGDPLELELAVDAVGYAIAA